MVFSRALRHSVQLTKLSKTFYSEIRRSKIELKEVNDVEPIELQSVHCARGMKDYGPKAMVTKDDILSKIIESFKRHGGEPIDTPVPETRNILMKNLNQETEKSIFDIAGNSEDPLSLRYDLTVPFARFLVMNRIKSMKRYQIGKVYRRDTPQFTRGRYREFFQCDFDIAGEYDLMLPEAECMKIIVEVLSSLDLANFEIKVNHRLLLEGILDVCGVDRSSFKTVIASLDKLDKKPWKEIKMELVEKKVVLLSVADQLETLVQLRDHNRCISNTELLATLGEKLRENEVISKALEESRLFLDYCSVFGAESFIKFDPLLCRGFDYYTGIIYEAVFTDSCSNGRAEVNVGSVAGGGRYDNLVSSFDKNHSVPCVGVSFGVDRILHFCLTQSEEKWSNVRSKATEVFVASAQKGYLIDRMRLCNLLWDNNIKAEMIFKVNPKFLNQIQYCEEHDIRFALIIGEREMEKGIVKIRDITTRMEIEVSQNEIISKIRSLLKK